MNKSRNWNENELYKYAAFVHYHHFKLVASNLRKQWRVFKVMSDYIKTRNSNQCRCYNKKLMKKFDGVDGI